MSLTRKSMLGAEADESGVTRYSVLETLRQYGREQLHAHGQIEAARRAHAAYYAELAERLGDELITDCEILARRSTLAELDNFRTAVAWSLDAEVYTDTLLAIRIVAGLALLANTAKSSGLGSWAERSVVRLDGVELGLRAAVLGAAAANAWQRGDMELASRYASLAVADGIPSSCPRSAMAQTAASPALTTIDLQESIPLLRQAVRELQPFGDVWGVLNLELVAVILLAVLGDFGTAQTEIEPHVPRARELGNPTNLVIALYAFACAWRLDNPTAALVALEESFSLTGGGASDVVLESAHMLLGQIRLALGDVRGALDAFRSAFEVADRFGNRTVVLGAFWTAIQALSACEAYGPAAVCIGIAEKSHFVLFNPWTQSPDADHHARACEATPPRWGTTATTSSSARVPQCLMTTRSSGSELFSRPTTAGLHNIPPGRIVCHVPHRNCSDCVPYQRPGGAGRVRPGRFRSTIDKWMNCHLPSATGSRARTFSTPFETHSWSSRSLKIRTGTSWWDLTKLLGFLS